MVSVEAVRSRLKKLIKDIFKTTGASKHIFKGPIEFNKRSFNLKFNRKLTPKERAALTKKLKAHLESGNTRIKVKFIGKIKVGIDDDKRRVYNPLTGKRITRFGRRHKKLLKDGFREVYGVLVPPEVSTNNRNTNSFIKQFANVNNVKEESDEINVTISKQPLSAAPVPNVNFKGKLVVPSAPSAAPVPNVNFKGKLVVPSAPSAGPIPHINFKGKLVAPNAPGAIVVPFYNKKGVMVPPSTPGAVPVVFRNSSGKFVPPRTPGAVPTKIADIPNFPKIPKFPKFPKMFKTTGSVTNSTQPPERSMWSFLGFGKSTTTPNTNEPSKPTPKTNEPSKPIPKTNEPSILKPIPEPKPAVEVDVSNITLINKEIAKLTEEIPQNKGKKIAVPNNLLKNINSTSEGYPNALAKRKKNINSFLKEHESKIARENQEKLKTRLNQILKNINTLTNP
jgi:hypothetical protein